MSKRQFISSDYNGEGPVFDLNMCYILYIEDAVAMSITHKYMIVFDLQGYGEVIWTYIKKEDRDTEYKEILELIGVNVSE